MEGHMTPSHITAIPDKAGKEWNRTQKKKQMQMVTNIAESTLAKVLPDLVRCDCD